MIAQPDITKTVAAALRLAGNMPKQVRFAAAGAINGTLYAARTALQREMRAEFDRPTPYVLRSVLVRQASPDKLRGEVYVDFFGSGKGVAPEKILTAEVFGGRRRAKRSEVAFQRIGLLPRGFGMVPAKGVKLDAYGNVPGSFLVQLISYFGAFSEQGYRANMTPRRKANLARRGVTERGFKTIRGVEYFVSRGKGERNGRQQHLAAGIWQRSGIHGSTIAPVFFFVRLPTYWRRFDFHAVAQATAQEQLAPQFQARFARALATAR